MGLSFAAQATSSSWNVDADGYFLTNSNWSANAPGKAATFTDSTDVATFSLAITAPRTVSLNAGNRNLGGISFGNTGTSGYTLNTSVSTYSYYMTDGSVIQTLAGTGNHTDTISAANIFLLGNNGSHTIKNAAGAGAGLTISSAVQGQATAGNTTTLNLDGVSISGQNAISGIIQNGAKGGNLAVVKNGSGTWTLTGNNTFTGGLTLNNGNLRYYGTTSTVLGRGVVTINGGAFNHANTSATVIDNAMVVNGDFSLVGQTGTLWGGTMDLNSGTRKITVSVDSAFSTVLSNGGLNKDGTSTLTLSAANSYAGGTTVSAGTLVANLDGALGSGNVAVSNGATLSLTGGTANDYVADPAQLVLDSSSTLNLNFTGADTVNKLSLDGGATWLSAGSYDAAALDSLGTGTYTGAGSLLVTIPEPTTISLFVISGVGALLIRRIRTC
jgi:autotransporter-associated beta strand protein